MPFSRTWLFLILGSLLSACSSQPESQTDQTTIFVDYFIRYLQAEQELKAQTTFRKGESFEVAHPVAMQGGVTFQGNAMEKRDLQGQMIRYSLSQQSTYPGGFTFRFQDERETQQEYSLKMDPVMDFSVSDPIRKSKGMVLQVAGGNLQQDESLVLLFSDKQNRASSLIIDGPSTDGRFTIPAGRLADLSLGPGQLYLVKKKTQQSTQGRYEIMAELEYYTQAIPVMIGD